MNLSSRILQIRSGLGLSQEKFGELVGKSQRTVAAWEAGTRAPSLSTLNRLADVLDVPADFLLGRDGADQKEQPTVNDDGLRAKAIDRIQALPDPALERVLDFLEGIQVGRGIASGEAAAGGPADKST